MPQHYAGRLLAFDYLEKVAPAPHVVAFAIEILARRLALLLPQLLLLLANPLQLGDREHADRVEAHARGCGDPDAASRGMDAQVDVLDVLQDHVHGEVAQLDLRNNQYSARAFMTRKIRSTSRLVLHN